MCIKLLRVPGAYAVCIAEFPLNVEEMITAIKYKQSTKDNPEGISVILYLPDEAEIAKAEFLALSTNKPKFIETLEIPNGFFNKA